LSLSIIIFILHYDYFSSNKYQKGKRKQFVPRGSSLYAIDWISFLAEGAGLPNTSMIHGSVPSSQ